ncbi:MAG: carboxypeptidase-like regulatory domain-containing protein [Flavobacterium sp.]|uniref:carboxypeptidase-like regulatory domain-containing protein n=1 Tax=Flavobacterium sp. TaxID=239 RepID=UPI0022C2AE22|nr:carboxypeptidase-like regulatory domain-containing protein [Flavobacterium sp.]MCZ8197653.1 carboxypeptidase-like regulatory domain-containing protein [Flavobacterium sp.]
MKLNKIFISVFVLASLLFINCGDTNSENTVDVQNSEYKFDLGKTVNRAFKGVITDEDNNALSGVTVKMNGKTAITDANGVFTLSNVSVKERFAYLTAEKAGYMKGSRTLMTHENLNSLRIMMLKPTIKTIQSGVVSIVEIGKTTVEFDGAFVTESGITYNGAVKVYMTDMPANDPKVFQKMPGSLLAIDSKGEYKGLHTFGMVNVELKGSNNEKLQLATGHQAKITMSISPEQQLYSPNVIPLWFFDETIGLWKEDGFSTKVGDKYVGNVSHFTPWNNDWAFTVASLTVVAKNESDGTTVNGIRCEIFRPSVVGPEDHWNVPLISLGITGANGTLTAGVPLNEIMIFRAYDQYGNMIHQEELPASNAMSRTVYVIIPLQQRIKG